MSLSHDTICAKAWPQIVSYGFYAKNAWNVEYMKKLKKFGAGAGVVAIAAALATPAWLLLLAIKNEDKILKGKDKQRAKEDNSKRV